MSSSSKKQKTKDFGSSGPIPENIKSEGNITSTDAVDAVNDGTPFSSVSIKNEQNMSLDQESPKRNKGKRSSGNDSSKSGGGKGTHWGTGRTHGKSPSSSSSRGWERSERNRSRWSSRNDYERDRIETDGTGECSSSTATVPGKFKMKDRPTNLKVIGRVVSKIYMGLTSAEFHKFDLTIQTYLTDIYRFPRLYIEMEELEDFDADDRDNRKILLEVVPMGSSTENSDEIHTSLQCMRWDMQGFLVFHNIFVLGDTLNGHPPRWFLKEFNSAHSVEKNSKQKAAEEYMHSFILSYMGVNKSPDDPEKSLKLYASLGDIHGKRKWIENPFQ
mmetsp:Transcript_26056/g.59928  ORF Transcript_26056/g.59928 Transcript_26056/m.59928 type:complete len:330 (-) Transcript_26056:308-1297(-)